MARWIPPANGKIESNEQIGRRFLVLRPLKGAGDQKPMRGFALVHFEERRPPGDVSVDRLGAGAINKQVKVYLEPRCSAAVAKIIKPTDFTGWAVVGANKLRKPVDGGPELTLVASPEALKVASSGAADSLTDNDYHAHIERPEHSDHYGMATHLRQIFETADHFEPASIPKSATGPSAQSYSAKPGSLPSKLLARIKADFFRMMGWDQESRR